MKNLVVICLRGAAPRRERAFTLIELMALIAALAMLGVMIRPALARTGDGGTRAVCINNLRQMGLAVNMYASDNTDRLAFANWDGGGPGCPQGWLYYVTNGAIPDPGPNGIYANNPAAAYQTGLWYPYIKNPKSYLCPVDIESRTYQAPASQGGRNNRMCSYVMNGAACGFQSAILTEDIKTRTSDAWSPKCYLMWEPDENADGPGNPGAFEFNDGANYPRAAGGGGGEGLGRLHTVNRGSLLSIAGQVTFLSAQQFAGDSLAWGTSAAPGPHGKTYLWWSPYSISGN